jgi:hypothetical protein
MKNEVVIREDKHCGKSPCPSQLKGKPDGIDYRNQPSEPMPVVGYARLPVDVNLVQQGFGSESSIWYKQLKVTLTVKFMLRARSTLPILH